LSKNIKVKKERDMYNISQGKRQICTISPRERERYLEKKI